jgi:hypothetical protein
LLSAANTWAVPTTGGTAFWTLVWKGQSITIFCKSRIDTIWICDSGFVFFIFPWTIESHSGEWTNLSKKWTTSCRFFAPIPNHKQYSIYILHWITEVWIISLVKHFEMNIEGQCGV